MKTDRELFRYALNWHTVFLRYVEGLSVKQIAERIGKSPTRAGQIVARGERLLNHIGWHSRGIRPPRHSLWVDEEFPND